MRYPAAASVLVLLLPLLPGAPLQAGVNQWTSEGPFGGQVVALAIDALDPSLIYAGTFGEGVFRSVDGGEHWTRALSDKRHVQELLPDPSRPGTAYLATWFEGIWKTTDRGTSWDRILECGAQDLALDPGDSDTLVAAIRGGGSGCDGIQRTRDGGETWSPLPGLDALTLAVTVDPTDSDVLFAGTHTGIYRSSDGGNTFTRIREATFPSRLMFDPSNPTALMMVDEGLHRSSDGGSTWDLLLSPGGFLAIHPLTGQLWVASQFTGLQTSTDGGSTWQTKDAGLAGDPRSIVLDPSDPERLFVGTEIGLFRTVDGGETWLSSHSGMNGVRVFDVLPGAAIGSPGDGEGPEAGYEDRPLLLATSVGLLRGGTEIPEDLVRDLPSRVDRLSASRVSAATVYAASAATIWRSTDGGATWTEIFESVYNLGDFEVAPSDPRILYAGARLEFQVSFDAGDTWESASPTNHLVFHDIDVDAVDPLRAYAVLHQRLFVSENGVEFVPSESPPPGGPATLFDLEADPYRPGRIIASTVEGWFRSDDFGATWQAIGSGLEDLYSGGLPGQAPVSNFRGLTFHPGDPDLLYAATNDGVRTSIDGGETWVALGKDLAGVTVYDVAIDSANGNRLLAGTEQGLYTMERITDLSLHQGRFRVEVEWKDFDSLRGAGFVAGVPPDSVAPIPLRTRDSTIFWFFGSDNWEAQLKVLDGRPINDHFWVFFSAATTVGYELRVTDTVCDETRTYPKAAGPPAPAITDGEAFPGCVGSESPPSCVSGPDVVCLGPADRFRAELDWTTSEGEEGPARQVTIPEPGLARSDDSGVFYFFGPGNWELLVKVLDGCSQNDRFWVFAAASTDVEYTLRVTDTVTDTTRVYENPLGRTAPAVTDVDAFAACDP